MAFAVCISCEGILTDEDSSAFLREVEKKILQNGHKFLIFDLQKVRRVSSLGMGVLAYLVSALQKMGGEVVFFPFSSEVDKASSLLGFQPFFKFVTRVEDGIRILGETIDRKRNLEKFRPAGRPTRKLPKRIDGRKLRDLKKENRNLRLQVQELEARLKSKTRGGPGAS